MTAEITIQLQSPRWKTRLKSYRKLLQEACIAVLGRKSREITIVLADDAFIHDLNKTYRGKNKPTNVLSFPNEEGGDIVLAIETIEREAKEQGKSLKNHVTHLVVHGTLHLLGHDHMKKKEAERMEQLEIKILKKLGIENPYCEEA